MFSILHRMIFWELFRVFFMCWVGLTGMILVGGVIAEATQQGLGPMQILEIIPFLIPSTMPYTLPTTTLFATCVVYGRLAHDNEILAVKAAGINLIQVTIPAFALGILASIGTMYLFNETIPVTHWQLRTHFVKNVEDLLYGMLKKDGFIRHPQINYTIYVKRVEGKKLLDATFMHRDLKKGGFDVVARGREAVLEVDLPNNVIKVFMKHCFVRRENGDNSFFEDQEFPVELPANIATPEKNRPTDMSWSEMFEYREKWNQEIDRLKQDIANHEAALLRGEGSSEMSDHIRNQRNMIRMFQSWIANIVNEFHMRPALSLGCLCFVMVGCPIGIWFSKSDYLSSFITCFLPIVIVYYPLMLCGVNLGKSGKVNPLFAIWPANVLMTLCALYLMRRLLRN